MKVKESHWREAEKTDKNDRPGWARDAGRNRQATSEQTSGAANKSRQTDAPPKDDVKFDAFLESPAKLQKASERQESSSEQRNDDSKKDKKDVAAEKDANDRNDSSNAASDGKTEKYETFGGQTGGGQSGFGTGGGVNQLSLNENFAARSILHVADLERLVSIVRTQTNLGGRREIVLHLKQSVLEGLQVKITTDSAAAVQIEFLAANENVRSQINNHAPELSGILRGRGINLGSLTASLGENGGNRNSPDEEINVSKSSSSASGEDFSAENTFGDSFSIDDKIYQA